jgi:DNA-binding response OmpR family regulator
MPLDLPEAETVLKPFDPPELMRRLHELLGVRALSNEAAE